MKLAPLLSARGLLLATLSVSGCTNDPAAQPDAASAAPNWPVDGAVNSALDAGNVLPWPLTADGGAPSLGATPDAATTSGGGDAAAEPADGGALGGPTSSGTLPNVTDLAMPGPFTPTSQPGASGFVLSYPKELGKDGVKHPIVSWGPGAAENAAAFTTLLNHLASHGFAVVSYDGTPQGTELATAIDWMIAENGRTGSTFYQKLDTTHIAAGGHSAGSLATFRIAADPRLTTTLHISGGTFDPHTDINNLHAPALFICGEPAVDGLLVGDVARSNCDLDFDNAKVPVFYGITKGAAHMTPTEIGDATLRSRQLAAMAGWLRVELAGDTGRRAMFAGSACTLCSDPAWTVKAKGLN